MDLTQQIRKHLANICCVQVAGPYCLSGRHHSTWNIATAAMDQMGLSFSCGVKPKVNPLEQDLFVLVAQTR